MNVLTIYGSLSSKSINRGVANAMLGMLPEGMTMEIAGVADMPLFNADIEMTSYPPAALSLKNKIKAADGIIIVTPEYNRSMPGSLKNAIDWTSRPDGDNGWLAGKPVAVCGASTGMRGASFAQYDVKRIMMYFNCSIMGQPEFYLANSGKTMDEQGNIIDERTKESLKKFLAAFKVFVESMKK